MTLRTATADDLEAIMALERASFPTDAWSEAMMREELASQGWNVGRSASQIVPVVVGEPQRAVTLAPVCQLMSFGSQALIRCPRLCASRIMSKRMPEGTL